MGGDGRGACARGGAGLLYIICDLAFSPAFVSRSAACSYPAAFLRCVRALRSEGVLLCFALRPRVSERRRVQASTVMPFICLVPRSGVSWVSQCAHAVPHTLSFSQIAAVCCAIDRGLLQLLGRRHGGRNGAAADAKRRATPPGGVQLRRQVARAGRQA